MNKFLKFFVIGVIICGSALGIAAFVIAMKSGGNSTESYQIIRENLDENTEDKTDDKVVFKCEWGGAKGLRSGASHKSCTEGEIPYGPSCPVLPKDAPWKCTAEGCIQVAPDDPDGKYETEEECQAKGACGRYECNALSDANGPVGCIWHPGTKDECKPTAEGNAGRCSENPKASENCDRCWGFKCNIASPGECEVYTGPSDSNPLEYACLEDGAVCATKFGWKSKSQCEESGAPDGKYCRPYGCVGHPEFSLNKSKADSSEEELNASKVKGKSYDNICGLVDEDWKDRPAGIKNFLTEGKLVFRSEADCKTAGDSSLCLGYGCTGLA